MADDRALNWTHPTLGYSRGAVRRSIEVSDNVFADAFVLVDENGDPIPAGEAATTGIGHGVKTVTAAGTDEALAASTACRWVSIQAQTDNTGIIAVGGAGVDATVATGTGIALAAGDSQHFIINDLATIFIDATVSGEGVRYTYGT